MTPASNVALDISSRIRALGFTFDSDVLAATRAIYRSHLDMTAAANESADVAYGPHVRHRLDIYRPSDACRGIVVFVHGGGFVAGDKNGDGVFYRNIGRWLARNQFGAVLMNYRLAPDSTWPAGARDVQAALQWVAKNCQMFGDGAQSVVLWGQSAGASHVASWLFDDDARAGPATSVAAVMLMSGFYAAEAPLPPGPRAYFGDDPELYSRRSPLTHVKAQDIPLWLGVAELDPGWIASQTYSLAKALTVAHGRSPTLRFFDDHNHVSTVQSLGSPQTDVSDELLRYLGEMVTRRA
jgi:acetyl esterase/lipase